MRIIGIKLCFLGINKFVRIRIEREKRLNERINNLSLEKFLKWNGIKRLGIESFKKLYRWIIWVSKYHYIIYIFWNMNNRNKQVAESKELEAYDKITEKDIIIEIKDKELGNL